MQNLYKRLVLVFFSLSIFFLNSLYSQDTIRPPQKPRHNDILSRMDFGGYFGAQFGDITLIDIAPLVSYRVTEKFHAGLGITYQFYKDSRYYPDYKTNSYGGSIFGRYFIWRDLFGHFEYAPLNVNYYDYYYDNNGSYIYREKGSVWVHDVLLGGGYRQWMGQKAFMSLMFLWNVNETYFSPYRNPIIRIGFGVGF